MSDKMDVLGKERVRKGREPSEQSGQGWPLGGGDVSGKILEEPLEG